MPRVIAIEDEASASLGECIAGLTEQGFEPREEESLIGAARWLRRLGNERDFLARLMLKELKERHRASEGPSSYGAQVIMLSPLGGEFFLRANIWPSREEHMFRASGPGAFVYELPHDHNFDFLTLGYFGPGYSSDYYEYRLRCRHGRGGRAGGTALHRSLHPLAGQDHALPRAS